MRGYRNDRRILQSITFRRLGRRHVGIGLLLRERRLWIRSIRGCEVIWVWNFRHLGLQRRGLDMVVGCRLHKTECCDHFKAYGSGYLRLGAWVKGVLLGNAPGHLVIAWMDGDL